MTIDELTEFRDAFRGHRDYWREIAQRDRALLDAARDGGLEWPMTADELPTVFGPDRRTAAEINLEDAEAALAAAEAGINQKPAA